MVPMINTEAEARSVVTYSKFPPLGLRGQGSFFPSIAHGLTGPGYMATANETLITAVQIETAEGVENVEAIAAVPGIGEAL
jgi:4-hydroxy-2-oxoheptanedioate aldolase